MDKQGEYTRKLTHSKNIPEKVKEFRVRYGYSIKKLAERIGVSSSAISQIEHGKKMPSVGTLQKISDELFLNITKFFEEVQGG